jgi:hypothetical protein
MDWKRDTQRKSLRAGAFVLAIVLLLVLWQQNFNKLGSFYDYSIMTAAAGNLAAGLRPYRDFATVAQPLSLLVARGCEILFGERYLSLAYGNLLLSIGLFLLVWWYSRKAFPWYLALLIAVASAVASTLQHGIVWYNTIGMVILIAITLIGASIVRRGSVTAAGSLAIALLLILGGMNKVNFHVVDLCVVFFYGLVFWVHKGPVRPVKAALFLVALCVCAVAPILIETLWTHITVSTWAHTIILGPAGRAHRLRRIATLGFYLKNPPYYYYGGLHPAVVGIGVVTYIILFVAALRAGAKTLPTHAPVIGSPLLLLAATATMFLGATCVLVSTNSELQIIIGSYSLIGGVAIALICAPVLGDYWERPLRICCSVMAAYFLTFGGICCLRHARISYFEPTQFDRKPPGDQSPPYLQGVHLSDVGATRLAAIDATIRRDHSLTPPCWGPGLGLMSRIYGGVTGPAIPLWYDLGTSVYESSAPTLIAAIEHSGCSMVISDSIWIDSFPSGVRRHLEMNWAEEKSPLVIVFHRKVVASRGK